MAYYIQVKIGPYKTQQEAKEGSQEFSELVVINELDYRLNERHFYHDHTIEIVDVNVIEE